MCVNSVTHISRVIAFKHVYRGKQNIALNMEETKGIKNGREGRGRGQWCSADKGKWQIW
jgi:hypothetical protein